MFIFFPVVWGTVEYLRGNFASSVCSETVFSRTAFSFTNSILHAGRLVTESLEKGQAHVLLHPVPKFQYAENLLLRCKGKKISSPPPYCMLYLLMKRYYVIVLEINNISGYTKVTADFIHLFFLLRCTLLVPR